MSTQDRAPELHDRSTRGDVLSAEEQAELDRWHALQDQEENAALTTGAPPDHAELRAQLDAATAQLVVATQRVQALAAENEQVRQEIAALERKLAQRTRTQPA